MPLGRQEVVLYRGMYLPEDQYSSPDYRQRVLTRMRKRFVSTSLDILTAEGFSNTTSDLLQPVRVMQKLHIDANVHVIEMDTLLPNRWKCWLGETEVIIPPGAGWYEVASEVGPLTVPFSPLFMVLTVKVKADDDWSSEEEAEFNDEQGINSEELDSSLAQAEQPLLQDGGAAADAQPEDEGESASYESHLDTDGLPLI